MNRDATDLAGVRHEKFETLGSTNAEALARARAGERGPLWISAVRQTAGRGRRGNVWDSPAGNLYASLLLSDPSTPALAPQLSFVTGVALYDAVARFVEQKLPLSLKWPNDLLLNGQKIAGLLVEAESAQGFTVAIGIGVNCQRHPIGASYPTTDLRANGVDVEPPQLLQALAAAMTRRLEQWQRGKGFALIRTDWLDRAAGLGKLIKVRLPERQLDGIFNGIDDEGQLLLATSAGRTEIIRAGDVFAMGT